ncbi:hypothetical protein ACMAZF_13650 [Psychrobium sp. nBUS_13]|uniref:hypothetical protein n=1 Tax=Psychrobium sp. nBUS_13 TaxID=3395319 RepID=UPI003EB84736
MASSQDELFHQSTQVQQHSSAESHENTDTSIDDDCCDIDCCSGDCICPDNTCSSHVYLVTSFSLSQLVILSELKISTAIQQTHLFAASLYRPPIFSA